ncbi:MAG: hypothetical protein ACOYJG_00620 [Prevotella sp.]|jgi:hypothetical protein
MNKEDIKRLLQKWYDGQTSAEEEKQLMNIMLNTEVDEELKPDQQLLREIYGNAVPETNLKQRLSWQIDNWERFEQQVHRHDRSKALRWLGGIAASFVLVASLSAVYISNRTPHPVATAQDTYQNPNDAYKETEKALTFFSQKLNKGLKLADDALPHSKESHKDSSK